jgi:hypothetical protein
VLAPTTATGLLRSAAVAFGRDSQSTAFLSWPGMDELYSGVAKRTASASATAARIRATAAGSEAS